MKKGLIWIILIALPQCIYTQSENWNLKRDKNDMKVYVRQVEGSLFKELKLEFKLKTNPSSIIALLKDVEAMPKWIYRCSEAFIVKKIDQNTMHYYNRGDFPWPIQDRDFVIKNTLIQDPQTKVVRSESFGLNSDFSKKEDVIRVEDVHILWIFTPISNEEIRTEYYLKTNPKGRIPAWLFNFAIDQGPIEMIKKLKKIIKDPKYNNIN